MMTVPRVTRGSSLVSTKNGLSLYAASTSFHKGKLEKRNLTKNTSKECPLSNDLVNDSSKHSSDLDRSSSNQKVVHNSSDTAAPDQSETVICTRGNSMHKRRKKTVFSVHRDNETTTQRDNCPLLSSSPLHSTVVESHPCVMPATTYNEDFNHLVHNDPVNHKFSNHSASSELTTTDSGSNELSDLLSTESSPNTSESNVKYRSSSPQLASDIRHDSPAQLGSSIPRDSCSPLKTKLPQKRLIARAAGGGFLLRADHEMNPLIPFYLDKSNAAEALWSSPSYDKHKELSFDDEGLFRNFRFNLRPFATSSTSPTSDTTKEAIHVPNCAPHYAPKNASFWSGGILVTDDPLNVDDDDLGGEIEYNV